MKNPLIFCLILTAYLASCTTQSQPKEPDILTSEKRSDSTPINLPNLTGTDIYADAAIETCNCMHPMIEKVKKIDFLMKGSKRDLIEKEEDELTKIRTQVESCSTEIRIKYGSMSSQTEQRLLLKSLKENCPESYELLDKSIILK